MNTQENDTQAELAAWEILEETRAKLDAVTEQRDSLAAAIRLTLMENLHLADGDICTLKRLKDAVGFDLDSLENAERIHGGAETPNPNKTLPAVG